MYYNHYAVTVYKINNINLNRYKFLKLRDLIEYLKKLYYFLFKLRIFIETFVNRRTKLNKIYK